MTTYLRPMEPRERAAAEPCTTCGPETDAEATHWLVNDDPNFPHPVPVCRECGEEHADAEGATDGR